MAISVLRDSTRKTLMVVAGAATSFGASLSVQAASYEIDPGHTYPNFSVRHLGFSTMQGRFNTTTGMLEFDPAAGTASVEITIDATSIDTGHDKRDEHLRGADFFDTDMFPEITFKSTEAVFEGEVLTTVTGDLTMHGVTKPITLNVDTISCGEHPMNGKQICGFDASTSLLRSDFGIEYGLPAVGDEISLTIEAEAVKQE